MKEIVQYFSPWFRPVALLFFFAFSGFCVHYILFKLFSRIAQKTRTHLDDFFIKHCMKPSRWIIIVFIIYFTLPLLIHSIEVRSFIEHILNTLLTVAVAWMFVKLSFVAEEVILEQYKIDVLDNLRARKIYTQVHFLKKVAILIIVILAFGTILMTFERVRQLGTSILASAGIIGIIVGFAAQRSIGTLLAGLQIAFTQPIRIDDVVIVENEWGRVEEITLTYVVVRIWDLRRLVLPISYFIEKPFQNWTRVSSEILGTVYLYVDYTVP
ncbi:MAG TPA: mechanosensitive ion channel domain-containing protein, partial [Anaerolineae bacterium]|nr:mechanosensitive ion channel domain-containing protein [Anaerolineae bacterium]